jgi:hypothetical protein
MAQRLRLFFAWRIEQLLETRDEHRTYFRGKRRRRCDDDR